MKKGSTARHCSNCRKIIFWLVPTEKVGLFGEPMYEHRDVAKWKVTTNKYLCEECYRKAAESEG